MAEVVLHILSFEFTMAVPKAASLEQIWALSALFQRIVKGRE